MQDHDDEHHGDHENQHQHQHQQQPQEPLPQGRKARMMTTDGSGSQVRDLSQHLEQDPVDRQKMNVGQAGEEIEAPEDPVVHLDLLSTSRSTDAAYLAASDIADIAEELDVPYRLVGGNCVTLLVAAFKVEALPPRDTADADLGAGYDVVADPRLPAALEARGYIRISGNRFERTQADEHGDLELAVDVLAPAYGSQMRTGQPHGDLVVDEVPGLSSALARKPVVVDATIRLTAGDDVTTKLLLPDPVSALCMKASAWAGRYAERDAIDIWRLLEVAYTAGVRAAQWPKTGSGLDASRVFHRSFATPTSNPYRGAPVPTSVPTRVRALVAAVVAKPIR